MIGWVRQVGVVLLFGVLVCGCAHDPNRGGLVYYVNQDVTRISDLETMSLLRYGLVTGENYKGDEVLLNELNSYVIPQYRRFVKLLRECRPQTEELQRLHAIYVRGAASMLEGFSLLAIAVEHQDTDLVARANRKIVEGREMTEEWRSGLVELGEKRKVKLDIKSL